MPLDLDDDDLLELYNRRLIAAAAKVRADRRLARPDVTVERVSPLCGSRLTLDLRLEAGRVVEVGWAVRACLLGQLGTAVLSEALPGRTLAEAREAGQAVRALLRGEGPAPTGPWADLELLEPAVAMRNRHGSALLPFDAVEEALERSGPNQG